MAKPKKKKKKEKYAPQQARSRASLDRLLKATREVLEEKGLDGATIPRIAARAGLSPGAVYRHFPDKDALLRRVALDLRERSLKSIREVFRPEMARRTSLNFLVEQLVSNILFGYRRYPGMLRALKQFVQSHPNAAFRDTIEELEVETMRKLADFLLTFRGEVKHPDPDMAMSFSVILMVCVLQEMVVLNYFPEPWKPLLPKGDEGLVRELSRVILSYLQADTGK
jgi:AcrR family transcriptional regulator